MPRGKSLLDLAVIQVHTAGVSFSGLERIQNGALVHVVAPGRIVDVDPRGQGTLQWWVDEWHLVPDSLHKSPGLWRLDEQP